MSILDVVKVREEKIYPPLTIVPSLREVLHPIKGNVHEATSYEEFSIWMSGINRIISRQYYELKDICTKIARLVSGSIMLPGDFQVMEVDSQYMDLFNLKMVMFGLRVSIAINPAEATEHISNAISASTKEQINTVFNPTGFITSKKVQPQINNTLLYKGDFYIPLVDSSTNTNVGCVRIKAYSGRCIVPYTSPGTMLSPESIYGGGAIIEALTSSCIPVKYDKPSGLPYITVEGYTDISDGVETIKKTFLSPWGLNDLNGVLVTSIPRTVAPSSVLRYPGTTNTIIMIVKSLKCFTKEEGLDALSSLCPIRNPLAPVIMQVIREGTEADFNTSNYAAINRSAMRMLAPVIASIKLVFPEPNSTEFKPEYLPKGITKKDTKDFIAKFLTTKCHGIPMRILIESGSDDKVIEASEKYFEEFLLNGEKPKTPKTPKRNISSVKLNPVNFSVDGTSGLQATRQV